MKKRERFTVVVGNPPYSNFSANLSSDVRRLVERYKKIDENPIRERNALQLERNVNDDYVKFFALAEDLVTRSGRAIVGMITNNSFLDAQTLRGLRARLLQEFEEVRVLDLGGSGDLSGVTDGARSDENVFDIQQGVAITILARGSQPVSRATSMSYYRVTGTRQTKYETLISTIAPTQLEWRRVCPTAELFLFVPVNDAAGWREFLPVDECFSTYAEGFKTGFDAALIGFTEAEARDKLEDLSRADVDSGGVAERFGADLDKPGWASRLLNNGRRTGRLATEAVSQVVPVTYRPLDQRYAAIKSKLIKAPSRVAGQHLEGGRNICLIAARQVAGPDHVSHFLVSRGVPESRIFYTRKGTARYFPLFSSSSADRGNASSFVVPEVRAKLESAIGTEWRDTGAGALGPATFLQYAYAVFYSPTYRRVYKANLKTEFPRIPVPLSRPLFEKLSDMGAALISLHLLESEGNDRTVSYDGPPRPVVERVAWSGGAVWLDAPHKRTGAVGEVGNYAFLGVREDAWRFQIGGYQICEKWLKDRKGRALSPTEVAHYQKVVAAVSKTIDVMKRIDEVIDKHGGWPEAFLTSKAAAAA